MTKRRRRAKTILRMTKQYYKDLTLTAIESLVIYVCAEAHDDWIRKSGIETVMLYAVKPEEIRTWVANVTPRCLLNRIYYLVNTNSNLYILKDLTVVPYLMARDSIVSKFKNDMNVEVLVTTPIQKERKPNYLSTAY